MLRKTDWICLNQSTTGLYLTEEFFYCRDPERFLRCCQNTLLGSGTVNIFESEVG